MRFRRKNNGKFITAKMQKELSGRVKRLQASHENKRESRNEISGVQINQVESLVSQIENNETIPFASNDNISWDVGRRIVELDILAKGLSCCSNVDENCKAMLYLQNCVQETRQGLGSFLWINCHKCGELNQVPTGKMHIPPGKKKKVFDVNTKHASAMVHAGLGSASINRYLASINVPPMSQTSVKVREREIGPRIEQFANASCKESVQKEVELTRVNEDENDPVNLTASFDMGWNCKGSGKSYNSKSGHAVLIGEKCGKILNFETKISNCKQCEIDKTISHDCRMNWGGSSKAMEGGAAVDLIKETKSSEYQISTIINDEDSTTMSKIGVEIEHEVKKVSDVNHCSKAVGNALYNLKLQAKYKKILSVTTIKHIQKCFTYAIKQNKDRPEDVKQALLNVVPHLYNEHENCGQWCKHKSNPNARYKSLPHGQPLSSPDLRIKLELLFEKHAKNATQLCPYSSSNANESFNMTVAAKAPKSKHYSKSESLDFRVAAAVCQKNEGEGYLPKVFKEVGLSPGRVTELSAKRFDDKTEKRRLRQASIETKKRRLYLKNSSYSASGQKELREGVTYQSSVALEEGDENDTLSIPSLIQAPSVEKNSEAEISSATFIVFDLETTSLSDDCEIVQISASNFEQTESFDKYVLPVGQISYQASKITGITKRNNTLFFQSRPVESSDIVQTLQSFGEWLEKVGSHVVLVAQNGAKFDSKHFWRLVEIHNLSIFFRNLIGFVDTLPIFRSKFPTQNTHKQEAIYSLVVGKKYNAHNAFADVIALIEILDKLQISSELYKENSITLTYVIKRHNYLKMKKANVATLEKLVQESVLSNSMCQKISGTGLNYGHLRLAYQRDEANGVRGLCTEKFNGKSRVTADKKIISRINEHFKKFFTQ